MKDKLNKVKRVLIVNPYGLGDAIFVSAIVDNLKLWKESLEIYYLCNKRVAELLKDDKRIYKIFIYEKDDFKNLQKQSYLKWLTAVCKFWYGIRKEKIDVSVDVSMNAKLGLSVFMCGISIRSGLDYRKRGRFLTHKVKLNGFRDKHVVEYYLDTLRVLNIPVKNKKLSLCISENMRNWADEYIEKLGYSNNIIISIAPLGGESFGDKAYIKRWGIDKFVSLIRRLLALEKVCVFVFCGCKEKDDISEIKRKIGKIGSVYYFSDLNILETASLISKSSLMVANDTGLLRFANALDIPTIAIFGPVDDKVYGLYPDKDYFKNIKLKLPCRPCYNHPRLNECDNNKKCLNDITVEMIENGIIDLLNKS